jgi:predicted short-subunit dehydrogenase-like oxidoreductase (DUF2520 family)
MNEVSGYSIGIVGAGAVARALGRALHESGAPIDWLSSRSPAHADTARADIGGGLAVVPFDRFAALATHVVIAISDDSLSSVCRELAAARPIASVVVHTSGAQGMPPLAPLRAAGASAGVFHPLQSIPDGSASLQGITFATSGDAAAIAWCRQIAAAIAARTASVASEQLPLYHAGAVLASNGLVGLIDAASELFAASGMPRETILAAIEPLVRTTVDNMFSRGTTAALTGPVARGDASTVGRHLEALGGCAPEQMQIYRALSGQLMRIASRRGLEAGRMQALQMALDDASGER